VFYIFDWDGTISDSADKIVKCMQEGARDLGLPVPAALEARNIIGLGLPEAVRTLFPDLDDDTLQRYARAYSTHFVEKDQTPSPLFPGALDTLENLKTAGYRLAVATGKSRRGLERVLGNLALSDFFHASRCADETASKPHPLMIEELLNEMRVDKRDAVMVGDTEWDMVMADRAGIRKIAVSFGAHSKERLQSFSPDLCVDKFEDILSWKF